MFEFEFHPFVAGGSYRLAGMADTTMSSSRTVNTLTLILHGEFGEGDGCLESVSDLTPVPFEIGKFLLGPTFDFLFVNFVVFLGASDVVAPYFEPAIEIWSFVAEGDMDTRLEGFVENALSVGLIKS